MNFYEELNRIKCLIKNWGITIIRIGANSPDKNKHNTLQVQSNGDMYIVDKNGEMQKIGIFSGGGNGGSGNTYPPIEVQIGFEAANTLGFMDGDTSLTHPNFANSNPEIFIGNINLYMTKRDNDDYPYFLKDNEDTNTLTNDPNKVNLYNIVLADKDTVKIKFL